MTPLRPYLHLLADAFAAEILHLVEVVCRKAACKEPTSKHCSGAFDIVDAIVKL